MTEQQKAIRRAARARNVTLLGSLCAVFSGSWLLFSAGHALLTVGAVLLGLLVLGDVLSRLRRAS